MKFIIVFAVLVTLAVAGPVDNSRNARILRFDSDNNGLDGYRFAYESSDGTSRSEEGSFKNPGSQQASLAVRGTVTWIGAEGTRYTLNYVADENGFQPEGAHLPRP